jgi:hypothetical protein
MILMQPTMWSRATAAGSYYEAPTTEPLYEIPPTASFHSEPATEAFSRHRVSEFVPDENYHLTVIDDSNSKERTDFFWVRRH